MPERKIQVVEYTETFLRHLLRLSKRIAVRAQERENVFKANAFDPSLNTHKLHGKDREAWAFSVNYQYRIKFFFLTESEVLFLDIGTHDQAY